jgi:hypothetical protein
MESMVLRFADKCNQPGARWLSERIEAPREGGVCAKDSSSPLGPARQRWAECSEGISSSCPPGDALDPDVSRPA